MKTRLNPSRTQTRIAAAITLFIEAEAQLASRHHGAKGRKASLIGELCSLVDIDEATASRWIDWAVLTLEMALTGLSSDDIGRILADTLVDGFAYDTKEA
jgi:hypothetical protein